MINGSDTAWVLVSTAFALLIAGSSFAASPWALYGSFASMGSTTSPIGGLRYSLNSDICFDLGAGANLGYEDTLANNFSLYLARIIHKIC